MTDLAELIGCAERELSRRQTEYPAEVMRRTLPRSHADAEIERMESIVAHLKGLPQLKVRTLRGWATVLDLGGWGAFRVHAHGYLLAIVHAPTGLRVAPTTFARLDAAMMFAKLLNRYTRGLEWPTSEKEMASKKWAKRAERLRSARDKAHLEVLAKFDDEAYVLPSEDMPLRKLPVTEDAL